MTIRACIARFKFLLEVQEDHFEGVFADLFNNVNRDLLHRGANTSMMMEEKTGDYDPETMMFDGCFGRLQRNESDMQAPMINYPVVAPGLEHGYVVTASRIMIVSAYNTTSAPKEADVMAAFNSFRPGLWLFTWITILTLAGLLSSAVRLRLQQNALRKKSRIERMNRQIVGRVVKVVTGNLLKQLSSYSLAFVGRRSLARCALLLLLLFSFWFLFFFNASIKTEKVVVKQPDTINGYEDLLHQQPQLQPSWVSGLSDHWDFKHATRGSLEAEVWDRAVKMQANDPEQEYMVHVDPAKLASFVGRIMSRRQVWLGASYLTGSAVTNFCAFSREAGKFLDMNMWVRADEHSVQKLTGNMISAALRPDLKRMLYRVMQQQFERGITFAYLRTLDFMVIKDSGTESVRHCIANQIPAGKPTLLQPDVWHYRNLFLLSAGLLLTAAFILVIEAITTCYTRSTQISSKS